MSVYRESQNEGVTGATVVAADIFLDSFVGTAPVYQEPGEGPRDNAVFYESNGSGDAAYGLLTTTFSSWTHHEWNIKIFTPPVENSLRFIGFYNAGGTNVAGLTITSEGQIRAQGTADPAAAYNEETTKGVYAQGDWVKVIMDFNQDRGWVHWHLFDFQDRPLETVATTVGQTTIESYREGICETGPDAINMGVLFSYTLQQDESIWIDGDDRPNIFFGLLDDGDPSVFHRMSEVVAWGDSGVRFHSAFAATPLCSPDRAAFYTGRYPQNNGVMTNAGQGNWLENPANEPTAVMATLKKSGYRTCQVGKHINGYDAGGGTGYPANYIWQGIDWGLIGGEGSYGQFFYQLSRTRDGIGNSLDTTGDDPYEDNYLNDVLREFALEFIQDCDDNHPKRPWFLYFAPYSPHSGLSGDDPDPDDTYSDGAPPAPRHRPDSPTDPGGLTNAPPPAWAWDEPINPANGVLGGAWTWPDYYPYEDQLYNWNARATDKPLWEKDTILDAPTLADRENRQKNRSRAVQSADDAYIAIRELTQDLGMYANTWFFASSDNGWHHATRAISNAGKSTHLDIDSRMPVYVRPPGGAANPRTYTGEWLISHVDIFPTFCDIAGWPLPEHCDGRSFKGIVEENYPDVWRKTVLIQCWPGTTKEESENTDDVPPWITIRTAAADYTTYDPESGAPPEVGWGEAYDVTTDPGMMTNLYPGLARYRTTLASTFLTAYWQAQGENSWLQAQREFFLTTTDRDTDGPTFVVGSSELDLRDPLGRWCDVEGSTLPAYPAIDTVYLDAYNVDDAPEYDNVGSVQPTLMTLREVVKDQDELGVLGGARILKTNTNALVQFTTPPGRIFALGERQTASTGVEWVTKARIIAGHAPEYRGPRARKVALPVEIPSGDWRSLDTLDWSWQWSGNIPADGTSVTSLAGSFAPVRGAIIRIDGPMAKLNDMTDPVTGWFWNWIPPGTDYDLEAGHCLLVDCRTWTAIRKETLDWDFTTGDDVSQFLDSSEDHPELWRMTPVEFDGDPLDMRVLMTANGTGRDDENSKIWIRAYRYKYH